MLAVNNSINHLSKEVIPSVENRDGLARLSKDFQPEDVKFLLALNIDSSKEDCMAAAKEMTERLKVFTENGYSHSDTKLEKKKYVHRIVK